MLPHEFELRKKLPVTTGVLDYFPLSIAYMAMVSYLGNEKHNPGQPLHWAREKSNDHADCAGRHLIDRKCFDNGILEAGQLAWRALADLQLMLEQLHKDGYDIWAPIRPQPETLAEYAKVGFKMTPPTPPMQETTAQTRDKIWR